MIYDIFISYRRSSYDTANLIATRLRSVGYSVFFDMETLRSGKFNEQLYEVIDNCKDFVVVLPPNALDRCVNEDDWVRLEICRAMASNKNIVPVMLNGFTWPEPMPQGLEELKFYHALTASSIEYFDLSMERLQTRYLLSKRKLPIVKALKYASVFIATMLAITAILWTVFSVLSKDVCLKYATHLIKDAACVHVIAEQNSTLAKDWTSFDNALNYEMRPERIASMQSDMESRIDLVEKNIAQAWQVDSVAMEISPYQSFLLSINGINAAEIAISPQLATLYYTEYKDQLNILRNTIKDPNSINRRYSTALFDAFNHSMNVYYASILSELSSFPKKSLAPYNEMSKQWIHFPIQVYKIGEDQEYYENVINTEYKLADEVLSRFESMLEQQDAALDDIERKNDELEKQIEDGFSELQSQISSAVAAKESAAVIDKVKRDNEAELAVRREKAETKQIVLEASKAELEELDKQYIQVYESLKKKCTLEESDDQWYKWGKVCRWGNFLSMLVESRQNLKSQGIYSTSSVTPEVAYADMNSLLAVYQTYHPEARGYVASAKLFYRELSKGERAYAGVIIFGFKDDAQHPFLRSGDIVVKYDNKSIKNLDEFKKAYKANPSGDVEYLRLQDGGFVEHKTQIVETDIIGFLELTE